MSGLKLAKLPVTVVVTAWPGISWGQSDVRHLFGMPYYTLGGVELLAFIVLVATYLLVRIVEALRGKRFAFWRRWSFIVVVLLVWEVIGNWDIYRTSREADRLCREEGGLHVYRTVEAEGFYGGSAIKYWSGYGFRFVESGKTKNGVSHWTLVDGEVRHRYVPQPTARYQWKGLENLVQVTPYISRSSSHVIDRRTGEELGRLVWFTIEESWPDRLILSFVPAEHNPWICGQKVPPNKRQEYGEHYYPDDLVKATIKPTGLK